MCQFTSLLTEHFDYPLRWLIYVFNSVVNTKLPAIDKQSNFTCTKKLFKRDWFEQSLMTDFIMFSRKSEKKYSMKRDLIYSLFTVD